MDFSGNPANIPQLAFTHAGRFHADDVFSSALLRILRPDIRIYRGFEVPKNFSGIVYDIGNGEFDHHDKNSPRRPNGVKYASLGLLWKKYGTYFLPEDEAKRFDDKFIQPLDLDDNNGVGNTLAGLIGAFNPTWDAPDPDSDKAFFEAVDVAQQLLAHKLESLAAVQRGNQIVRDALKKIRDNVVTLPLYVPWKPVLVESDAEFVVFESTRGGYSLVCVPKDYNGKTGLKVPLPTAWRGVPEEQLQQITGIDGFTFCHASGFMATCATVEQAYKLAAMAKQEQELKKIQREEKKAAKENTASQNAESEGGTK